MPDCDRSPEGVRSETDVQNRGDAELRAHGRYRAGKRFMESVKVATPAVRLGGRETLVPHPALMTYGPLTDEERWIGGITEGLVRVSVGLEDTDDLIEDFDRALRSRSC